MYTGDDSEVAFIDFQNTGFHHLFRDFVSFESSVRLELPDADQGWTEEQFISVLEGEEQLVRMKWDRLSGDVFYINQISKVRHAANQNFPDEDFSHYLLANTVHSLWLLAKGGRWPAYQKRRLVAAILAGLTGLSELRKE
jgi:hypothetical protein